MSLDELFRLPPDIVMMEIRRECDGSVAELAHRIRKLLKKQGLGDLLSKTPITIRYSDRYISSPLTLRLVTELISAFAPSAQTMVEVRAAPIRPARNGLVPSKIFHDWPENAQRKATVDAWLKAHERQNWAFSFDNPLSHARRLCVDYSDRQRLLLTLDQGIGFLECAQVRLFPFERDAFRQAASLDDAFQVRTRQVGSDPATFWTISREKTV